MTVTATHEPEQGVIHVTGLTLTVSLPEAVDLVAQLGAIIDQAAAAQPMPEHDGYRITGRQTRRMIDGVPQVGDIWDGHGRVHDTVRRIIDVCPVGANSADEIERSQAAISLRVLEEHGLTLDARERAAVLRRFPETVEREGGTR